MIIWKKLTSAVPQKYRFGKQYQIIAFFTKGKRPRIFHRLRIDLPLEPHHKFERENGVYATDLWTDIRELTAGYFAGDEALRDEDDNRLHKQQAPVALLTRIILASSNVGDLILDPFSGTGTTGVVAKQLNRRSINIEIDPKNVEIINMRLKDDLGGDDISELRHYYRFTKKLDKIWPSDLVKEKRDVHGSLLQFLDKSRITEKTNGNPS
ncbi:MAG: hypothetical protein GF308_18380 [Candidatus Heimdallarchaeota archaeon]|nr:hypothetical protein [Candidatus Heimdallarchaeota archaeon]